MSILWLSDLHLDRASPERVDAFYDQLRKTSPEAAILTGDTSHATRIVADLERLASELAAPLWFVLGNHDHYGGGVGQVRDDVIELGRTNKNVGWLPPRGVVTLPDGRALVGVDGWADGRFGQPLTTPIVLNDDRLIAELARQTDRRAKLVVRRTLADADAVRLTTLLGRAIRSGHSRIVIATHVPPFVEALPPTSRVSHPDWHPVLISRATGTAIYRLAIAHPEIEFEVLAGHSHRGHQALLATNLTVRVAPARYGQPCVLQL